MGKSRKLEELIPYLSSLHINQFCSTLGAVLGAQWSSFNGWKPWRTLQVLRGIHLSHAKSSRSCSSWIETDGKQHSTGLHERQRERWGLYLTGLLVTKVKVWPPYLTIRFNGEVEWRSEDQGKVNYALSVPCIMYMGCLYKLHTLLHLLSVSC